MLGKQEELDIPPFFHSLFHFPTRKLLYLKSTRNPRPLSIPSLQFRSEIGKGKRKNSWKNSSFNNKEPSKSHSVVITPHLFNIRSNKQLIKYIRIFADIFIRIIRGKFVNFQTRDGNNKEWKAQQFSRRIGIREKRLKISALS